MFNTKVNPVCVNVVAKPLSVQFTISVAPILVPTAYQYAEISEFVSAKTVQFPEISLAVLKALMSLPIPSATVPKDSGMVQSIF